MKPLSPEKLAFYHDLLTLLMLFICVAVSWYGHKTKDNNKKQSITFFLLGFALLQEILDYVNRFFLDTQYNLSFRTDLPLQFCHFGFYFSILLLYFAATNKRINIKIENFIFDCAFVLGFAGAFQSLLNFDDTGINNMIGAFVLNWQHSLIILNVLWLIFAYDKRFTFQGVINAFIFMNLLIIPVGFLNFILDANYMFICQPPNVESSFFIGDWPIYILWLEIIYFIYILILLIPFKIAERLEKHFK